MKKILNMVLLAVFAFATVACDTDNIKTTYSDLNAANLSLSGAKSISYTLGLEESSASFSLDRVQISRPVGTGDLSITLVASVTGKGNVTVDPVSFTNGQTTASPSMSISNLGQGETCKVVLSLPETNTDATINGKTTSFTVNITREKPASWVPVKTKSQFKNGFFGGSFSYDASQYPALFIYPVEVEKMSDADIFRVKNVMKSSVCPFTAAVTWLTDQEGDHYMTIDCTDPENVTVARTSLGIDHVSYTSLEIGTFDAFGYPDDPKGEYDASNGIIKFSGEALGIYIGGAGLFYTTETILYLDENKMGADFTRDYTFVEYAEKTTVLNAAIRQSYESPIYVGMPNNEELTEDLKEKYGTVYCLPSYLTEDYNIYFGIDDKGKFVIPDEYKQQSLGVELLAGVEIFMSISKSSVMENGILYLAYDIVKEDGTVIGSYTDRFYILNYEADPKAAIGKYTAKMAGAATEIEISDDTEGEALLVSGIFESLVVPFNYDGTFKTLYCVNEEDNYYSLTYDGESIYSDSFHTLATTSTGAVVVIPTAKGYQYGLQMAFLKYDAEKESFLSSGMQALSHEELVFVPEAATDTQEIVANMNAKLENYKGSSKSDITIAGQKVTVIKKASSSIEKFDLSKALKK